MAFVTVDLAESIVIATATATDASNSTEGNLNDGLTTVEAVVEIRAAMSCYKITHDIGFAVANLDTLSIQCFDGSMMNTGVCPIYPYSAGDTDVVTGNEVNLTINDNGAYDTVDVSAIIPDLGDVGTNQISIRIAYDAVIRGRFTEIEIEFAEVAGGPAHIHPRRQSPLIVL